MNVLLTGGTGYIASHTAVVLIEAGLNIVLLDNLSNSQRDVVDRLEKITSKKITFVEGDIRDKSLVSSVLSNHKVDAVIHYAGLKAVGESVSDPLTYFDNNLVGTIKLLEAMQENNIKKIVFSSSATVYGNPQYLPIDENHPTTPVNPYGRTKLHIEEILRDLSSSDHEWSVMCLRYFNPVGAHESGLIGDSPKGSPSNLMPYISGVIKGNFPYVKIFGDNYPTKDGTGVRDYIHVVDLSFGHLQALEYIKNTSGWFAVNLGTGKGTSVLQLLKVYSEISNKKIPYKFENRRLGDVASIYTSNKFAKSLIKFSTKKNIRDMCLSEYNWLFSKKSYDN